MNNKQTPFKSQETKKKVHPVHHHRGIKRKQHRNMLIVQLVETGIEGLRVKKGKSLII